MNYRQNEIPAGVEAGASVTARVINPLLADEQLRGGMVQGLGAAPYEECLSEGGQLRNGTMADYLVPMSGEMPDIVIGHVETPVEGTLLGAEVLQQPYTPQRILEALRDAHR